MHCAQVSSWRSIVGHSTATCYGCTARAFWLEPTKNAAIFGMASRRGAEAEFYISDRGLDPLRTVGTYTLDGGSLSSVPSVGEPSGCGVVIELNSSRHRATNFSNAPKDRNLPPSGSRMG
jgi:hypothetical protein